MTVQLAAGMHAGSTVMVTSATRSTPTPRVKSWTQSSVDFALKSMRYAVPEYQIKIKRDFGRYGYWDSKLRKNIRQGFVVVKGHCNCIPGAMWFKTIEQAMLGVEVHMETGDTMEFHDRYRQLATERGL